VNARGGAVPPQAGGMKIRRVIDLLVARQDQAVMSAMNGLRDSACSRLSDDGQAPTKNTFASMPRFKIRDIRS
jgi:hypothetical protein